jgi:cytoskeleton protein RodZ
VTSVDGTVGSRLRQARVARGIDLDEAFEQTRINKRFLQALERDAPPSEFPAPLYARAFLEEYARYLGLDPEPLLAAYGQEHAGQGLEPPPIRLLQPLERPRGPWLKVSLTVASVLALVAISVFAARFGREDPTGTQRIDTPPPASPSPVTPTEEPAETERPPLQGVHLAVAVEEQACWISVTREGEVLLADTVDPGFSETFRAPPGQQLDVVFGNAGAVRVRLNREPLDDIGGFGEVYTASFIWEDGEARVIAPA